MVVHPARPTYRACVPGKIGLVPGKQTEAANLILHRLPDVQKILDSIPATVEQEAGGFVGNSAAGLVVALSDWLTVAGQLPQVLAQYAGALAEVDRTAAAADQRGADALQASPDGSGLNMR